MLSRMMFLPAIIIVNYNEGRLNIVGLALRLHI